MSVIVICAATFSQSKEIKTLGLKHNLDVSYLATHLEKKPIQLIQLLSSTLITESAFGERLETMLFKKQGSRGFNL